MTNQPSLLKNPGARSVSVFVPSREFECSLEFYQQLGWQMNWKTPALAQLELAGCLMLLQDFYARKWADNFMLYVAVDDAEAWYHHAAKLVETGRFADARVSPPKKQDNGDFVTHVWDPCGVLLHFTQSPSD